MSQRTFTLRDDFEINPASLGQGLTQSEMQCWDNCPEKWYLGYNLMLYKQGKFSWALTYGGWIHGALQEFYSTGGKRWSLNCNIPDRGLISHELLAMEDYWVGVANIQMDVYASHYKHDFQIIKPIAVEKIVDTIFEGIRLKGMVDMYAQDLTTKKSDGYFVWDHKTTSRIDRMAVLGWEFRFQFMFYDWLADRVPEWKKLPCKGFMLNAIKKPQIKQGKGESLDGFLQRLQSDMQDRPEVYFYREKLQLKKGNLNHFQEKILRPKLNRIKLLLDPLTPPQTKEAFIRNKNTDHCISKFGQCCEFLPLCQHGQDEAFQYRRREVKHLELMSETPDE